MKIEVEKKAVGRLLLVLAVGALAGFVNGFLGAGAGIVLMYAYGAMNRGEEKQRDNFAMTVATVVPISIVSVAIYASKGAVNEEAAGRFLLPAVIGGLLGGYLTDKLNTKVLRLVFSVIVIVAGVNMIWR